MWEDDINKNGGRWVMFLDKDSKQFVDKLWHDLVSSKVHLIALRYLIQ